MNTRIVFAVIFRIFLSGVPPVLVKDPLKERRRNEGQKTEGETTKAKREVACVSKKEPEVAVQRGNASGYV
jgi:hypothetical protein